MSEPSLNADFLDLLTAFQEEEVVFLVVGAFAVAAHGAPRQTGDIDLWIEADADNAVRVFRALARFGAPIEAHGLTVDDLAQLGTVYQMGLPPRRIDLLTQISGVRFKDAWARRVEAEIGGVRLAFLSLRDLLCNKRACGRPKDLLDIELLREAGVAVDE